MLFTKDLSANAFFFVGSRAAGELGTRYQNSNYFLHCNNEEESRPSLLLCVKTIQHNEQHLPRPPSQDPSFTSRHGCANKAKGFP